ncbi:MAG TPA: Xaa-Pro peptidase family protein [Vicinamibacterales bacterium]|nr:Xaa-Pro peptidase family protein [Vicinamibacterales bacterium]
MRDASMTRVRVVLAVVATMLCAAMPAAERMGYSPGEFTERRQQLAKTLQRGTLVMFGATAPVPGLRFRQDHDFYYLTGNESLNGVLVMDVPTGAAHLFLPKLSATEIRYEGGNWLEEADAAKKYGFASIQPLTGLHEFLARRRSTAGSEMLWSRLSERDQVNHGRLDVAIGAARRLTNPFAQQPTEDAARVTALREQFPYYEMKDVTPQLDRLRLIKSPREIEILKYNGRISAEAVKRAMQATAPGKYEYELEAEATYWMFKHGIQAAAYPAIVGSGPMGNQWHYEDNSRQMQAGELVVMDYAGSLDYLTMDITRTWPVSGRFTDAQLRAYECVLEAQKAIIAAIKPGVARSVVQRIAEDIYKKHGFDSRYAYVGHYVGMSVHDVGDWNLPFEAGMVLAIEPIIDVPEQQLHIRVEDSVLVTPTGVEILSTGLPKEAEEIMALLRQAGRPN